MKESSKVWLLNQLSSFKIISSFIKVSNYVVNIANGIWSGFPLCCVMFYSYHNYKGFGCSSYPKDHLSPVYVRCKKCIKNGVLVKEKYVRKGCLPILSLSKEWKPCGVCGKYYGDRYKSGGVLYIGLTRDLIGQEIKLVCDNESCKDVVLSIGGELW